MVHGALILELLYNAGAYAGFSEGGGGAERRGGGAKRGGGRDPPKKLTIQTSARLS